VVAPSAVALVLLGDAVRPGWELRAAIAGLITVGAAVMLATASSAGSTAPPVDASAPPVRGAAIPVGGRLPLALPSRDSESGTILWWGSPTGPLPIWRPPNRTHTAAVPQAVPIGAGPHAAPAPMWTGPEAARPLPVVPAPRPLPAVPVLPPPEYEPEQPPSSPRSGTVIWAGPPAGAQAIWKPPDRTRTAPAPPVAAEPSPVRPVPEEPREERPYRSRSAWVDPPAGL
jgi:hypothetical protein